MKIHRCGTPQQSTLHWTQPERLLVMMIGAYLAISGASAFGATGSWSGCISATNGPDNAVLIPLTVTKRELIDVRVSGNVRLEPGGPLCSPSGHGNNGTTIFGYTWGIVMLRIGENNFPIEGGRRTLESPRPGSMFLYVNDYVPSDNEGCFSVTVIVEPAIVGDADGDGLDDACEDELLEQFAPEIKFDEDENVAPVDIYWYLRSADLLADGDEDSEVILDRQQAPYYPEWILAQESVQEPGFSTNILDYTELRQVSAYCNVWNEYRYGYATPEEHADWNRVVAARNRGIYGHVTPSGDAVVIQYWFFYPWNSVDAPLNGGDHEGDWELFEVFVDASEPTNVGKMKRAVWHAHENAFSAKWEATCIGQDGQTYVNCWEWYGSRLGPFPAMPSAHAPIFVEAGTHGSWPFNVDYGFVGKNRGNWHSYVASNITNVGEIHRPRLGCEVVVQFSSRWGAFQRWPGNSPVGPPLHPEWVGFSSGNKEAVYVGSWDHGRQNPNGFGVLGRISWPFHGVFEAVVAAKEHQEILIFPGIYDGALVPGGTVEIAKPVTLRAPHGAVTIIAGD